MDKDIFNSINVKISTPDGDMFVNIMENPETGKIENVIINLAKPGSSLRAWADALGRMIGLAVRHNTLVHEIMAELFNITSDRGVHHFNRQTGQTTLVRSSPMGVYVAFEYWLDSLKDRNIVVQDRLVRPIDMNAIKEYHNSRMREL